MIDGKTRQSQILDLLDGDVDQFISILEKLIKISLRISDRTEEIQEEIQDQNKSIQVNVEDINYNFWFRNEYGKITSSPGIIKDPTARIILPKNILIQIVKQEITGSEAFMQGMIKIQGNIGKVMNFRNSLQTLLQYLAHFRKDS